MTAFFARLTFFCAFLIAAGLASLPFSRLSFFFAFFSFAFARSQSWLAQPSIESEKVPVVLNWPFELARKVKLAVPRFRPAGRRS